MMDGVDIVSEGAPLFARLSVQNYRTIERKAGTVLVLLANALERAAFFSVTSSLVYFLTKSPLCWTEGQAITAGFVFHGATYILGVCGGFLADFGVAKFAATVAGFAVYLVGYSSLPYHGRVAQSHDGTATHEINSSTASCRHTAAPNETLPGWCGDEQPCASTLYATFLVIACGAALVQTNLATFGADQVSQHGLAVTRGFFSWLYWTRNGGALIANAGIAYLQIGPQGFFLSSLASLACLLLSAILFVLGFRFYIRPPANRPAIKNFFAIIGEGFRLKKQAVDRGRYNPNHATLDHAKVCYGGSYHEKAVEEVKSSGRMLVVFALLIFYWIGFAQLTNSFQVQGLHLKLPGPGSTEIPPAVLLLFDNVSVLLTLPLLDNVIYPYIGRRGRKLTLHIRMSVGMLFATLSFAVAGCVEHFRLRSLKSGSIPQQIGYTIYDAAPMSVFVQIPQYMLLGVSEAFTVVTVMEYTYVIAPKAMRSVMMGILLAFAGIGTFASSALAYVQKALGWSSINEGRMDWVFYALAAVQLVSAGVFCTVGSRFNLGLDKLTIATARSRPLPHHLSSPTVNKEEGGASSSDE